MTERLLRQLETFMWDSLSNQQIDLICFHYLGDVHVELEGVSWTKSQRIEYVLAYVRKHKMTAHLVAALYERHGAQMVEEFPDGLATGVSIPAVPLAPTSYERNPRQIFLSHANQDAEFARRLADDLELEGWQVWLAPDSIVPGEQWTGAIERGLATSAVFVLVLSPDAVASRWVQTEMNVAIALQHEQEMAIVPLLFRPCKMPYLWRAYQHVSFTRGAYPLPALLKRLEDDVTPEGPAVSVSTPQIVVTPPPKPKVLAPPPFDGIEWVEIPAGEFWMGDDKGRDNEKPCHRLHLDTFWIAKTPVTNAQWHTFVVDTGYKPPNHWQKGQIPEGREQHPVIYVNWYDAREYCHWLEMQISWVVNLPSEAEWEKAARGSKDKRRYPWDNWRNPYNCNTREDGLGFADTTLVDKYPSGASPYGVLDMSGNVWEWTRSLYDYSYPYELQDGREDLGVAGFRVRRGGSYHDIYDDPRISFRGFEDPFNRMFDHGLRVVVAGVSPSVL